MTDSRSTWDLMDPHLGVIEPGLRCKTCGHKVDECPGHFGNIDLAMPVIHVGYVKEIKKLLQSTCRSCGRLLLTEEQAKEYMASMDQVEDLGGDSIELRDMAKITAKDAATRMICPHCGADQLKITLDKPTTFREDGHKLTPKEVRERLERIPDQDLDPLGIIPEVLPSRMDDPHRSPRSAGNGPPLHHPGVGRQVRGRPHPQTGGRAQDQPEVAREP